MKDKKGNQGYVLISGYYGFNNLGDEAILEELIYELGKYCRPEEIVVLSSNPQRTQSLYKVRAIERFNLIEIAGYLRDGRLFISGGGGLFQDSTSIASVFYYAALVFLAKLMTVPVVIYAQGIGPLKSSIAQLLTRLAFAQASLITVRDDQSLQLLRDWGLRGLKSCDPVFALAARFSTAKTRSKSELSIGISLRRAGIIEEADLVQFADVIKRKIPARSNIVLLSLQPSEDKAVMDRLKSLLESEEFSIESVDAEMFQRPSEWFGVLNNLDLLIGMRLHALIMSLGMEVPCIGLSYDPKVTAVLNSFAQPYQKLDWAGNGKDLHFNVETLDKSIDDMLHQLDEQRSKIKVCLEEINALSCHNSQMLDAYLSQSG